MSENVLGADNQQGSPLFDLLEHDPSETTRRTPFSQDLWMAYLQGALHDGTFSKNKRYRFSQKGEEWLLILKDIFTKLGYNSWIYKEGANRDVYVLETLADFLNFDFRIENQNNLENQLAYIRGFFDAEGGIPQKSEYRFYIQFVQKDKEKLQNIAKILNVIGIKTGKIHNPSKKVDPHYWRFFVSSKSYERFIIKVGSWHPRKAKLMRERMKI